MPKIAVIALIAITVNVKMVADVGFFFIMDEWAVVSFTLGFDN
jgi:hypothetical protein